MLTLALVMLGTTLLLWGRLDVLDGCLPALRLRDATGDRPMVNSVIFCFLD